MKAFFENIQFAEPFFLWLACALPLLWFRFSDRRVVVLILRTTLALLLILILADPQLISETRQNEERIFAYDRSQSISPSLRNWMGRMTQDLAPSEQDRIFVFGADATTARNLGEVGFDEQSVPTKINDQRTNLENLLSKVLEMPALPR